MSDLPVELDLKFLPAWLKEAPTKNPYADFEGEREDSRRGRDDRRGPQGRGERRGPRPPQGGGGPRRDDRDSRGGRASSPGGPRGQRDDRDFRAPRPQPQPFVPQTPVVKVEILPEPAAAAGIAKQIKGSGRACGVFRVAKMFLERFERFRVRITALDPTAVIHQVGEGPVAFDSSAVDRGSFRANLDRFYVIETVQGEAPKGNYTSVARDRLSGALLGPPNHHGYQVAMRKLYEERYCRRMSFPDFQRNIDIVSDTAAVEQWKQQSSSVTTYKTKVAEGEEPVVLKSEADAEQHFRATFLPKLMRSANSLEVAGEIAGAMLDRRIGQTVRDAVDHEREVPVQMVNSLRPYFSEAGLHLFKWKRKMLFASAIRPQRHPEHQVFSEGISAILTTVGEHPGIKRPQLAAKLIGTLPADATEEAQKESAAKVAALAGDLHYLVQIGYVVEFQTGNLELPPPRQQAGQPEPREDARHDIAAEAAGLREAPPEAGSHPRDPAQNRPQERREPRPDRPRRDSRYALLPLATAASVAALA